MLAVGAVSALAISSSFAQTTTKETTTSTGTTGAGVSATTTTSGTTGVSASTSTSTLDGTGTITTYTPGQEYMSVRTTTSEAPVKYYTSKNVTIVDQAGVAVEPSLLRADLPVRYSYVKEGDRMVISKITVQKPLTEIKETTTTTTTIKK
jgi:hypothetical protein